MGGLGVRAPLVFVLAVLASVAAAAAGAQPVVSQATYTYVDIGGVPLKADVYTSATSPYGTRRPAVVFVHGGGWTCGNRDAFGGWPRHLAEAYGVVAVTVSYRLAPITDAVLGADGRIAHPGERDGCSAATAPSDDLGLPQNRQPYRRQLDDLRDVMWQLRTHADALLIDRHRIAVVGASAGGHLAGMLGVLDSRPLIPRPGLQSGDVYSRPNAVVSIAGPWNLMDDAALPHPSAPGILRNLFGGEPSAYQRKDASPTSYFGANTSAAPTLFIHGAHDTLVPPQQSIEACTRMGSRCAGGQPLIVQTPPHVDPHDTLYLLQQRYDAFIAFLAQTIASPPLPGNQ